MNGTPSNSTPFNSHSDLTVGAEIPVLTRTPDSVDLFSFSAASWLLHRIHYDVAFTTEHEGHPGLLVHGPLQGTYMIQSVQWWLGTGAALKSIEYRHSSPAYVGDTLTAGGTITAVHADTDTATNTFTADLWVRRAETDGTETVTTSGTATFGIPS